MEQFSGEVEQSLSGIQTLLNRDYEITITLRDLQKSVKETADNRRLQREQEKLEKKRKEEEEGRYQPKVLQRKVSVPKTLKTVKSIDSVIDQLTGLKQDLQDYDELDITFEISDSNE